VVLLATLALPTPTFAARGHGNGSSLPGHFSRPLDGVGDTLSCAALLTPTGFETTRFPSVMVPTIRYW